MDDLTIRRATPAAFSIEPDSTCLDVLHRRGNGGIDCQ